MNSIRQKIRSRSGITLFAALAAFLVFTALSAAMLSAVSGTASGGGWRDEQAYLSIRSAAALLQNAVCGELEEGVDRKVTIQDSGLEDGQPVPPVCVHNVADSADAVFMEAFRELVERKYNGGEDLSTVREVQPGEDLARLGLQAVRMTFRMEADSDNLTVQMKAERGGSMTLIFRAVYGSEPAAVTPRLADGSLGAPVEWRTISWKPESAG